MGLNFVTIAFDKNQPIFSKKIYQMTKTVIEISHSTLRKAESAAEIRGITLSQLVSGLIEESVVLPCHKQNEKPWMVGFGDLADLADENHRILELIEEEFGIVDENDCQ